MKYTAMSEEMLEEGYTVQAPQQRRHAGRRVALLAAAGVAGAAMVALASFHKMGSSPKRGDLAASQEKAGLLEFADAIEKGLEASAKVAEDVKTVYPDVQAAWGNLSAPSMQLKREVAGLSGESQLVDLKAMSSMTPHDLLHPKNISTHDGNLCADDEEEHLGMCYQKCAAMTNGEFPIRTTAWSCCMERPCSFFNSKFVGTFLPCKGFDVSGAKEGGGCPHSAGACMENEEFNLGICYKKCAVLTNNSYPYRSAASSCCRYKSHIACLDALNVLTSPAFNTGGGLGDHDPATPGIAHTPMPELAEAGK